MVDPLNKRDETVRTATTLPPSLEAQTAEQKLQTMLSALWERSRHTVAERAALLQRQPRC